ncbi:histidine phosphatase superfamily [Rhypophila decipiens]|uniref:Histidine phosphatase superfamily n=1 Tax=Rhypophila decipiens TaxID=261697 RepID=A0AAN6Y356_9PEZI|nr:histidine phosphatase superfamily [Rhypophila decipiens]
MADAEAQIPRVFIVRHGETEWAKIGKHTGKSDIELTPLGIRQVASTASQLVGPGKLLDPTKLIKIFVSPRKRALQTFETLLGQQHGEISGDDRITITEDIAEWDYVSCHHMFCPHLRATHLIIVLTVIYRSPQQVAEHLGRLVEQIKDLQRPFMRGEKAADVLIVAHGLILRVFVKRWLGYPVDFPLSMLMMPGSVGILTLNHSSEEPAFQIGMALPAA